VVPVATSRMTQELLPPPILELMKPDHVAPIVTYLAHESSAHTGECFEVGGGWYSKVWTLCFHQLELVYLFLY